jgi:hypothetical protein
MADEQVAATATTLTRQMAEPRVDAVTCRDDGRRMLEHAVAR